VHSLGAILWDRRGDHHRSAAPAAVNIHPHGHKHGSHVQSLDASDSDSGSDTAAQIPA